MKVLWHISRVCRPLILSSGFVIVLAACTGSGSRTLTQACVEADRSDTAWTSHAALQAHCECASAAAKKYLDPDDYDLVVRLADIYSADAPDDVKLENLITTMSGWGVSSAKASAAAIDIMFMAHRVAQECPAGERSNG